MPRLVGFWLSGPASSTNESRMSPALAFFALLAGLALGVLVLGIVLGVSSWARPAWILTTLGVILAVMVVPLPGAVRDRLNAASEQGRAYRVYNEQNGHRKCLQDFSRPDLVGMVDFARARIPPDAMYRLTPQSGVVACLAFNLLPRLPVSLGL